MTFREGIARAGFQEAFEGECSTFISELHGDVDLLGAVGRRVSASTGVVRLEPCGQIARHARVVARRIWLGFGDGTCSAWHRT